MSEYNGPENDNKNVRWQECGSVLHATTTKRKHYDMYATP